MKQSLDKATLRVTVASTIVAVVSAAAAFWSGYEAHRTRIDDERPFLTSGPAERLTPDPFLRIQVTETGKSPATNIRIACKSVIDNGSTVTAWNLKERIQPIYTFPYLQPTIWVKVNCESGDPHTRPDSGAAVELGVIDYEDLSGHKYRTPFCFTFQVPYTIVDVHQCSDLRNLPGLK